MVDRGSSNRWAHALNSVVDDRVKHQAPIEGFSYLAKDFVPTPWSVLCGRGRECYESVGNRRFRVLVDIYLPRYTAAESRMEKSVIVMEIVDTIRAGSANRGGFVKYDSGKNRWYEVGDDVAREKVGNQFRLAMAAATGEKRKRKTKGKTAMGCGSNDDVKSRKRGVVNPTSTAITPKKRRKVLGATRTVQEISFEDALSPEVISSALPIELMSAITSQESQPEIRAVSLSMMYDDDIDGFAGNFGLDTPLADDEDTIDMIHALPNPTPLGKMAADTGSTSVPTATLPYQFTFDETSIVSDDRSKNDCCGADTSAFILDLFSDIDDVDGKELPADFFELNASNDMVMI